MSRHVPRPAYQHEPHDPISTKAMPWLVRCRWCGLVYLRNEFSRRCVKAGCNNADHPDFPKWRAAARLEVP